MTSILETKDLTIAFGGHVAVDHISVQIPEKQFTSVIGPNGAGKTTFFNLLSGQLQPTEGEILL
ncbi:ATP-binding cassette domain-containing protein, partial [Halomonas sp. THAF12]|uniref:ATP-binding cassette domain-containing protein n=1 Tax=Halomonas sp. B23F22_10 TaxID=3459515 RepID=UPI00373F8F62